MKGGYLTPPYLRKIESEKVRYDMMQEIEVHSPLNENDHKYLTSGMFGIFRRHCQQEDLAPELTPTPGNKESSTTNQVDGQGKPYL